MRTERKLGAWLIAAGIVLVAAGLGIVGFNLYDEYRAGRGAAETTEALKSEIAAQQEPVDTVEEQVRIAAQKGGIDPTEPGVTYQRFTVTRHV